MTSPDVPGNDGGTREASADPVLDPTDLIATPEMHQPGQPPGGWGPTEPSFVYTGRAPAGTGPVDPGPDAPSQVYTDPHQGGEFHTDTTEPDPGDDGPQRPADSALKPDWVAWAVLNGATPDAAEAMTKNELIEKYGS